MYEVHVYIDDLYSCTKWIEAVDQDAAYEIALSKVELDVVEVE